jgi:hypothetical protein
MAIVRCAHAGCTCLPSPEMSFCCTHCEQMQEKATVEEVGCGCGHYGCDPRSVDDAVAVEVPLDKAMPAT